jgi:hypothetical protein
MGFRHNEGVNSCSLSQRRLLQVHTHIAAVLAIVLAFLPDAGIAKSGARHPVADRDYISALAAANSFLHAWQTHDTEAGVLMLSDAAKRSCSEPRLRAFFASTPMTAQGFLITRGRKLSSGRYLFELALLEAPSEKETIRRHFSRIVVVRAGKQDWAVDNIP